MAYANTLANKRHQAAKAKAKAAKHFKTLFDNHGNWVTAKVVAKKAKTSSVCGKPGCPSCSKKAHHSYTAAGKAAKVAWVE